VLDTKVLISGAFYAGPPLQVLQSCIKGEFQPQRRRSGESLRILEDHLSPRALGLVIEWAAQHRNELWENWELTKNNQAPKNIEPLK